jgi:aryl-alcohol dehydrogenase-like predicted oxidoreductase
MEYRLLGGTGLRVSVLSVGGTAFSSEARQEEAERVLARAAAAGITYIDTAPAYGSSERVVGRALESVGHGRFIISTKLGGRPSPFDPRDRDALRRSLEQSLEHLRRDCIDILFIHEPDHPGQHDWFPNWERFHGPVTELLEEARSEGLVRFTGLAGTTVYTMARIVAAGGYDVLLTAFNSSLLWQESFTHLIPAAVHKGMGVVLGSPLQHGALARCYTEEIERGAPWLSPPRRAQFARLYDLVRETGIPIAELALRYVLHRPGVSSVLTGMRNEDELRENLTAEGKGLLPRDITQRIAHIAAMVPFRPYEEPYKLPFGTAYRGPGHIGSLS